MSALESVNMAQLHQRGLCQQHDKPVLAFPKEAEKFSDFHRYTLAELKALADAAASWYHHNGLRSRKRGEPALVVGLCARGNIDWVASYTAIVRTGHTVLIISPRLQDNIVAALADKADASIVVSDRDIEHLTQQRIPTFTTKQPQDCKALPYEDLVCDPSVISPDDVGWIAHSSGSTGIPKLFPTTHLSGARESSADFGQIRTAFMPKKSDWISSAPYNVVGMRMINFCLTKEDGALTYFDNDSAPFTAATLTEFLLDAKPDNVWTTPYSLELISSTAEGMRLLQKCDNVKMFGSVLPQTAGDRLTAAGIHIGSEYGMSEGGMLMTSTLRPRDDLDWDYLMPAHPLMQKLIWLNPVDPDDEGPEEEKLYEVVVANGAPNVLEEVKDANGDFYTGDVVVCHPTKKHRYKVVGRKDDQLKVYQNDRQQIVNAHDYEGRIRLANEDIIEEAVLFGQGKNRLGVLIFAENACGPSRKWVLERVWKTISNDLNTTMKVPIEKDMIRIISGTSEIPRTTKLNFIRPQVYRKYHQVIDDAYNAQQEYVSNVPLHATLHAVRSR